MPARLTKQDLEQMVIDLRLRLKEFENYPKLFEQLQHEQASLQVANEELRVTEEELRSQADELIASRGELELARERYKELYNEAPDGYVVTNKEGFIREANKLAVRMLGHTIEGLTKRPYLLKNFLPSISQMNSETLPNSPLICQLFPLGGKPPIWVAITVSASYDNAGLPMDLRWAIRDITEQKKAQEALRESEEKFSRAFAVNPAAIVLSRLEDGRVLEVNNTWVALTGYHRDQIIGHSARDIPIWVGREAVRYYVSELKAKGFLRDWEQEFRKKSGEIFVAQLSAQVLNIRGDAVILSTLIDITGRKKAERELQELNDTLEKRIEERTLQAEKRALQLRQLATELTLTEQRERQRLSMVLHDGLQQILVAAKFNIALLERDGISRKLTYELSGLIDDCIATSRSLTVELSPPILFSGGLIPALEWLARWMKEKHGLSVKLISQEPIDDQAEGLKILLFESVRELLFNVVKHSGVKKARVEIKSNEGRIQIDVADAGVGFNPKQLNPKEGISGGMGLFSIKERLDYLGGALKIESSPGKGSRFALVAPFTSDASSEVAPRSDVSVAIMPKSEDSKHDGDRKVRIVLVDDHVVMRQGLAGLLRAEPDIKIVGEASDGESGIKLARETRPDIILMDISMPGLDGIQATKLIHKEMPEIKVIGLSMFQEGAQETAIREAGAVGYLTKSGPSEALVNTIRNCITRKNADGADERGI